MIHAKTIQRRPGRHTASADALAAVCRAIAANRSAMEKRAATVRRYLADHFAGYLA